MIFYLIKNKKTKKKQKTKKQKNKKTKNLMFKHQKKQLFLCKIKNKIEKKLYIDIITLTYKKKVVYNATTYYRNIFGNC